MSRTIEKKGAQLICYELDDDWIILVGKSDLDNEILSLKLAQSGDWWFHVHGMPGSHVILRSSIEKKRTPSAALLKEAAAVAAWHSKARNGGQTAVSCTRAENVSKPHGAKPGTVSIRKQKIYKVRPKIPS
jgi:predicted ribosome quality control (RQC) complex YloA/Tae2 family protein